LPGIARAVLADVDQFALTGATESRESDRGDEEGEQDECGLPSAAEQRCDADGERGERAAGC
jgi:hypothetical protein